MKFVNFSIAKKLKEKGFREKCLSYYDEEDNVGLLYNTQYTDEALPCQYTDLLQCHNTGEAEYQIDDSGFCVDAPTISQVLKWLEDKKQIYIIVEPFPSTATKDKVCWSWSFKCNSDGINIDHTFPDDFTYLTSNEAALAGIKYILNNLIT